MRQMLEIVKQTHAKVKAAVLKAIARANAAEPHAAPFGERAGLKPEIVAAFRVALAKVRGRETPSTFEKTSRGKSWYPRARGMFVNEFDEKGLPVTLRRKRPKRDKSVSARQAKRARMAGLRCVA